jgi:hypothetical protein
MANALFMIIASPPAESSAVPATGNFKIGLPSLS